MRPINSVSSSPSPASVTAIKIWKSPIPYLFGGLALMLGLISVALVILICSHRKRDYSPQSSSSSSSSSSSEAENMKSQPMTKILYTSSEPEVVVIMAGDHNPTYLAKPSASSSSSVYCTCGAQSQPEPESQPSPSSTSSTE
ncbi:protein GLUTAMINE DUMPER 6 [Vigna radiata var. radiata]|uniref:Protein GLUTAMINE DUMPER 6 n=1 Tax=Vigna radiata var. radiata TaxID=3916 RepID=A0A1S3TUR8_VIGRR|nr:protein GLUTAMINE DUMPER 6 [Vigna radiata var. radiata]